MWTMSTLGYDPPVSTYHHGNLRASLIAAGAELARVDGPGHVALREVARRAGVSHNAAYRHFADRDDLLGAVARVGMEQLGAAMAEALDALAPAATPERAVARLRASGRVYVEYAFAEPGMFRTAFGACPDPRELSDDDDPLAQNPFEILVTTVADLVRTGLLEAHRADAVVMMSWAAVHGFALLHLDGPMKGASPEDRATALEHLLDEVERVLG